MACNEAVYLAGVLITVEYIARWNNEIVHVDFFQVMSLKVHLIFFLVTSLTCTLTALNVAGTQFLNSDLVQKYSAYLYMLDSVAAIGLGWSLCSRNLIGLLTSMLLLTNFFMLHVVNRMFVAKKPTGLVPELSAMLKSYIHHTASFLFLDVGNSDSARTVIALTSVWRALSMSGHTAQALSLKKVISPGSLLRFNWLLSHARNMFVVGLLVLCYRYPTLRSGFGRSAVGHVAYILVRAGPVFRLGSVYVGDRALWQGLSDGDRLRTLMTGHHLFLSLEVGSLTLVAAVFMYWRMVY